LHVVPTKYINERMKFSIITATFNSLLGLQETVAQLKAQMGAETLQEMEDERLGADVGKQGSDAIPTQPLNHPTTQLPNPIHIEHIIIDGGSSDGTAEWLGTQSAQEMESGSWKMESGKKSSETARETPNYQLRWISEPDQGLYDALNKGLRLATGDVIGILHTDDVWEKGILARVVRAMDAEDRSWKFEERSVGSETVVDNDSSLQTSISDLPTSSREARPSPEGVYSDLVYVAAEDITKVRRYWKSGTYDLKKFYNGWMPPHTTLFVRKELAQRVGEYRLDLGSAADYEWMLRTCLVHKARLTYIPEVLVRMRVGGASNASIKGRLKAHDADQQAWELNGLKPKPWTLKMKVIRKLPQWVQAKLVGDGRS